jgi:hypothetical protein
MLDGVTFQMGPPVMNAIKAHQPNQSDAPSRPRSLSRSNSFPAPQSNNFLDSVDSA